jgi:predicted CoA-substrate-specific enzyme activase
MSIFLGIDVGTVSIKIALLGDNASANVFSGISPSNDIFFQPTQKNNIQNSNSVYLLVTKCFPHNGDPVNQTSRVIHQLLNYIPNEQICGVRACGSGGRLIGELLGINNENEFRAIASGVGALYPDILSVFEMGGQNSKYISLEKDPETGTTGISDYEMSGDCAAGTGSFLDQQALRLKYDVTQIGTIVSGAEKSAKIAGRCSVFAKSDMIHAQQKGFKPEEVLKGLCEAVARNFKSSIIKSKRIKTPALLIGGVAKNSGVVNAVKEVFKFQNDELLVPDYHAWIPAIGTALAEMNASEHSGLPDFNILNDPTKIQSESGSISSPLSMEKVILLRDGAHPEKLKYNDKKIEAYMGVDIGSVSTNVAVIDIEGKMLKEIYTKTDGRPIEVVSNCLREIKDELSDKINIRGVGTTGSGRELIGELIGSDTINDEITAHKTGAEFLAKSTLDTEPDTIFEIGGQDSKFISIENGVVVDFAMNEACAAGTGSFLEERAEELKISIKNEFAQIALSSDRPVKLGERCTVFMQQDVASQQQNGTCKADITAGLAYSIVYNYLNRVVGRRKIGNVIFFQGGTAYNDAIASAFAMVLDREIIVPPYNGVIGAVGAALLAREKMMSLRHKTKFRGFSLENVEYTLKEFTCKACSNFCHMQEFTVEEEKTYWGDQCSDKFRRRQSGENTPIINDLLTFRRDLLFDSYDPDCQGKATIGFPRGMYIYEHFPFWNRFFRKLGYRVLLSDETNANIVRLGNEASVAEPCLPVQVYHGHVQQLNDKAVDWIFIPNMINAQTNFMEVNSYYCPWGQTLPFVIKASPTLDHIKDKIISPPLRFRDGKKSVAGSLFEALKFLGETKKSITEALDDAYSDLKMMKEALIQSGEKALDKLRQSREIGIILVGRTYNIYDRGMTLDIGNKLRDYYGVNAIPMDFLPLDSIDITDIHQNMYWNYGRKIIAAAKFISDKPNLHLIYLTNFKCGPDSYVKHYITKASGKPFLTLQFDGHSNDAGYITRCEAYLDSKGALRNWAKTEKLSVA